MAHHRREASLLRQEISSRLRGEPLGDATNNGPLRPPPGAARRLRVDLLRVPFAVREQDQEVYVLGVCKQGRHRVYHRGTEIDLDG